MTKLVIGASGFRGSHVTRQLVENGDDYARDKGLPAVALCISTTYGPGDWQPTPHCSLLALVAPVGTRSISTTRPRW